MTKNETAVVEIILKGQQANSSLKDIEKSARALKAQLSRLPADSQAFAEKTKEFQQINKRLKSIKDDVNGVGGVFQSIGKEIKGFGIMAAGYLGFTWLSSSINGIIKSNAELSDSLADIRKTTGMTEAEARKLNTSFSQINTRTATKELRNIAIVGGQLGIAKGDIFGFTVAVDKMNVALGDEFTGGAEEVTKAMGGLRNIFSDIKTNKVDEDLLHIGNAINELASSGAATGPVVSDFANRIGGVGITLGLTSGQVLGLSATLQELNVSTERGGTAVTKILQKMTTNTSEFAKVAGLPLKEFTELVNKDLYGAFVKVVEGSKKGGASATAFGQILDKLGVDGAGASEVFAKLGNNTSLLDTKVKLANTSLKSTNSIIAEFTTKNSTLGAEMERLSKGVAGVFTNSAFTEGLKVMVGGLADLFDKTKKVSESMAEEQNHVNALLIEIKSANVTNERRVEIYDELKAINPEIVDGINRESISIQALTENVNEYNAAQINKIAIQKKQEQIDEANAVAAEKLINQSEKSSEAYEKLGKIQQLNTISSLKYKKILDDENLTTSEKIKQLYDLARANEWVKNSSGGTSRDKEAMKIKELAASASQLTYAEQEYAKAVQTSNIIAKEKNDLMKQLGMSSDVAKTEIDYTKLSIQELNKLIQDSTKSMGNYHRVEGQKALEELYRREKEKKGTVLQIDDETKKALLAKHKSLQDELAKLEREHQLEKMGTENAELARIKFFYDDLRKKANGNKEDLKRIEKLEGDDILNIMMKNFEKQAAVETKEYHDKLKRRDSLEKQKISLESTGPNGAKQSPADKFKLETIALTSEWDKRIADADAFNKTLLVGEEQYFVDLENLRRIKYASLNALTDQNNQEVSAKEQAERAKKIEKFESIYGQISQIANTFNQIQTNSENLRLEEGRRNADATKLQFKRLLDAKVISKREYDLRINKLDKQQEAKEIELKKKQAQREKNAAIIQATINTAISVSKALATGGPIVGAALAVLAAALGAVQIAAIASAPSAYAKGGFNKTSDDPQGFTTGATLYTKSASGKPFIAGEAGKEWISPSWMVEDPIIGPNIQMLEAVRQRGYASGGYNSSDNQSMASSSNTAAGNKTIIVGENNQLILAINKLNANLENGINARMSYDVYKKDLSAFDSAAQSAQVKS